MQLRSAEKHSSMYTTCLIEHPSPGENKQMAAEDLVQYYGDTLLCILCRADVSTSADQREQAALLCSSPLQLTKTRGGDDHARV